LTAESFATELDAHVRRLVDKEVFSGAVLVARGEQVLLRRAYGSASKRFDVPNTPDTRFNLASMNKMFTAMAVGQLVEGGKLGFDDPVSKHLGPDWLPPEIASKVAVRHLLTHTSGLGDYLSDPMFDDAPRDRYRTLDDYRPIAQKAELAFEPGTAWRYSNLGFLLLGVIVQNVSGMNYDDYVARLVYAPAGMTDSGCFSMDRPVPNVAIGYTRVEEDGERMWKNNLFLHVAKGGPAGGGYSTVDDLHRFADALRSEALVSSETLDLFWEPTAASMKALPYGYGFAVSEWNGERVVGHSGGFHGISARFDLYVDSSTTVVVLSNYDEAAGLVAAKAAELLGRLE
jgi:CubicO group peptidase (beta-lactamase class C family)